VYNFIKMQTVVAALYLCLLSLSVHSSAHSQIPIAGSAENVTPLLNGQFVPDVIVQTAFGKDINLKTLIESKPSLVIFYRGGWCPYCNRQMKGLIEVEQRIIDLGYQIIAISPDTPQRLQAQKTGAEFDVVRLSDNGLNAIRAFGLGYFLDDNTAQTYRDKLGANLVSLNGENKVVLPVPAAYIFDTSGLVQFQYVNPNFRVRVSPQLLFYAAKLAQ
jgi:peroxiredoxin